MNLNCLLPVVEDSVGFLGIQYVEKPALINFEGIHQI